MMVRFIRNYTFEIILIGLFGFVLSFSVYLWFDQLLIALMELWEENTQKVQSMGILFLSIFIEGLPFLLMGAIGSSLIHTMVKEELVWRYLPRNPLLSIPIASMMGLILPICECGMVPVTKRLIQKGFPTYLAFTFLLAAPVVNPITIISTYIAFGQDWGMVWLRIGFAAVIAILIGYLLWLLWRKEPLHQLIRSEGENQAQDHESCGDSCCSHNHKQKQARWQHASYHAIFEFFNTGKYFVLGGLIASGFQAWFGLSALQGLSSDAYVTILWVMGIAFLLSVCSTADAFIAASFRSAIGTGPLLAFMVYGPMMDLKNLLMMHAHFRPKVIGMLFTTTTLFTFLVISFWMWIG